MAFYNADLVTLELTQTGYPNTWTVEYDTTDSFETPISMNVTNDMTATITGLTAETQYYFRVKGTDGESSGKWIDTVKCIPTNMILIEADSSNTKQELPTSIMYKYSVTQEIYTKQELMARCDITAIDFKMTGSTGCTRDLDIYMVHTNKSKFDSTSDWITVTAEDLVFSGSVDFAAGEWTTVTFDRAFAYNGTQNVALIVDDNSGNWKSGFYFVVKSGEGEKNVSLHYHNDNNNPDPTKDADLSACSSNSTRYNTKNALRLTVQRYYDVTVADGLQNGAITVDPDSAPAGSRVTVTTIPNEGCIVGTVSVNEGAIEVTEETPNRYSFTMPEEPVTVSATFVPADPTGETLEGYSLSLGDDISLNYSFTLSDELANNPNAYIRFTIPNGDETETKTVYLDSVEPINGVYTFRCSVAAKEMTSPITAQIIDGNGGKSLVYTYTVKEYADYMLENADENGTDLQKEYAKAAPLVKAMLNYGASAQTLFEHRVNDLADKDLVNYVPLQHTGDFPQQQLNQIIDAAPAGMTLTNISLILESRTALRLYFTNTETTAPDIIETYTDDQGEQAVRRFSAKTKSSEIYYEITDFVPGEIFDARTLSFDGASVTFDVTIGNYANWAVNSSNDADLAATILALYNYDEYAKAYKDNTYIPGKGQGGGED